ncbi:ScbR family autoregulator-binding transcription factor [Streptomyces salinarius]|uniref:ScbR family autoregulator-binding transcription factor n=1 Tax=Streptomyces salinarius TaxID=2762598 RepID=UPI001F094748|nr:ScbR family autoregulator-binding transcription factor [Streptomyces salinarius]
MASRQTAKNEGMGATNARGALLKQERALQTRQTVLAAAAEMFAEHGFPAVTVMHVAESAEMTKGAVYFHFANKEALAKAVVDEFYRRLPLIMASALEMGLPPLQAVAEVLHRTALAFKDDRVIQAGARLQIERSYIDAELPTPFTAFQATIEELFSQANEEGSLRYPLPPEAYARVLVAAFFGAQHISWVQCSRSDIEDRVREIIEAVIPDRG